MRRLIGTVLIALALVGGSYGTWLIATNDVQGGRHAAGAMILGFGVAAAVAAVVVLTVHRRRD